MSLRQIIPNSGGISNSTLSKFTELNGKLYWNGYLVNLTIPPSALPNLTTVVEHWNASNDSLKTIDTSASRNSISNWVGEINGYSLSQSVKTAQPTQLTNSVNGKSVIRFDASSQQNLISGNSTVLNTNNFSNNKGSLTMAVRLYSGYAYNARYKLCQTGSAVGHWRWDDNHGYTSEFRNQRIEQYPYSMPYLDGFYIFSVRSGLGNNNYEFFINGNSQGTQNPSWGLNPIFILGGGSDGYNASFDVLSVVLRNTDSSQDLIDTFNFLNSYWGLGL